jgi:Alpha/beta hydrolase domain
MGNLEIGIHAVEPFAEGKSFGETGSYVRIRGVAKGELDPAAPENQAIADLDKAPRNARGLVEYETDFFILRPADPNRTNGVLVYDVTNRGSKRIFHLLDDAPGDNPAAANDPKTARESGLGFSLGRGYSLVWSGWDPGAPAANNGLGGRFPTAMENGRPVTGRIRHEFHIGTRTPGKGDLVRLLYPAVSTDKQPARLTMRDREGDTRTEIPAASWEFADTQSIRLLPEGTLFAPFKIYELWYEAAGSKVLGIGFASVRDLVSFLRYESTDRNGTQNPLIPERARTEGTGIRHALAFGVSQSGRFLRHFLELGMNDGGHARRVFDGVMSHVAGAGKVFANHRFGMPGRTATQHEDRLYPENWFPFGNAVTTDPFSRKTGAILQGHPTDPLVIETNSSTEYWQKGASLVHTDPTGRNDAELPPNVRVYMIAGTQHGGRPGVDPSPGPCVNPRNPHSATPALRALFAALEEWVTKGTVPPPSRVPRVADGTAVMAESIEMPAVPGFAHAPGANPIVPPVDWTDPPARIDNVYGACVCAVDTDGNETAGIRLPPIAVPLGTYTGWNVYRAQPGELADRDGSFIAFARTRQEREVARDPRPSLEERYGSREAYVAKIKAAAEALVAERLLLPSDAAAYVKAAEACDRF